MKIYTSLIEEERESMNRLASSIKGPAGDEMSAGLIKFKILL